MEQVLSDLTMSECRTMHKLLITSPNDLKEILNEFDNDQMAIIEQDYRIWAREDQLPPDWDDDSWLCELNLCGRG